MARRGAVEVPPDPADPAVGGGVGGLYEEPAGARGRHDVMQVYRKAARLLRQAGLPARRAGLGEEW